MIDTHAADQTQPQYPSEREVLHDPPHRESKNYAFRQKLRLSRNDQYEKRGTTIGRTRMNRNDQYES